MNCRECGSEDLKYSKHMGYGPVMGNVYEYRVNCGKCHASYTVKRTQEVYEKVKDQDWVKSKNARKQDFPIDKLL
jgi:C4-type Zn-finger protein